MEINEKLIGRRWRARFARWAGHLTPVALVCCVSCATTPSDIPAPVALPDAFTLTGETALPDRWWQSFGDANLNALAERAITNNLSLLAVWDRLNQAHAVAARDAAGLRPSICLPTVCWTM